MKYLMLGFSLLLLSGVSYAQGKVWVEVHAATDYIMPPEYPRYQSYGYDNQWGVRYGLGVSVEVINRLWLGIGADRFTRREDYDCVHFPDPDVTPQSNWQPLVNNPLYSCDYRTMSNISFLEIPLSVRYDFIRRDKLAAFLKAGYGYQFVTGRKTTLVDLQDDTESTERRSSFSLRSKNAFRISTGVSRKISERWLLGLSAVYRSDSFQLEYQSVGVELGLNYRI